MSRGALSRSNTTTGVYSDVYATIGAPRTTLRDASPWEFKPLPGMKEKSMVKIEAKVDEWGDHSSKKLDPHMVAGGEGF